MHRGKVLSRVRICVSGFHGIIGKRILSGKEKRCGRGGETGGGRVTFGITIV